MKREKQRKRLLCAGLAVLLAVTSLFDGGISVRASRGDYDTADLRLIFTTDIHGQITNIDYSTGALYPKGGLSKANTLIKEARGEVGAGNTLTFDLGDVMYDYTTDYIYDYDESVIQPIYQAMATMGYDAITLGNHDFEYTLPYIQNQLNSTGLADKVVVSNVKDANTGAPVWNQNKIIEKTLTTGEGKNLTVKVGIIGETIPTLSKKRCNYTGVLATEDIVANVTSEAQNLKGQGADVVVVLAHSGVGEEIPAYMAEDVGYALTKIDNVDVVLCGHKHASFCADGKTIYDSYAGVDTEKGLVNGKNLVMIANNGQAIGMVDLAMTNISGVNRIIERKSQIRRVKESTEVDASISNCLGEWANTFVADCTEILSEMDPSARLQNYFGTLEDDGVIQLLNDIGITYGLEYKNNENPDLKDLPVVSAAKYSKYGGGSGEDYYDISGNYTRADLYQMMSYRIQLWRYVVSGSQLKEWLEWSASAYETAGNNLIATTGSGISAPVSGPAAVGQLLDGILAYEGAEPLQYALQEEWRTNWSNYYVLDGIEYHIDTRVKPRYNIDGVLINDTRRVDRVTRNGKEIQDTDQFLLVVNRLKSSTVPNQFITADLGHSSAADTRVFFEDYLVRQSLCGTMKNTQDDNWSVGFSDKYQYVIKAGEKAAGLAAAKNWIAELLDNSEGFDYYRADFKKRSSYDYTGPSLNLRSLNDEETNRDVRVVVQANDASGLHSVRYLKGKYAGDSIAWDRSTVIDSYFDCSENGIYSVMAMDVYGNKTLRYIRINNVNKSILEAPKVNTYTNRKSYIEGTAEPTATVYFELENGDVYKTTVKDDGTFKYDLPPQNAGTKVYVYVKDDDGRASARTVVVVKRTGPNKPIMEKLYTNSREVTGELNDDTNVYPVFILEDKKTVFLQADGTRELYLNSELYNEKYKIQEMSFNIKENGNFSFQLPYLLKAKVKLKLRTLDVASRNSMGTSRSVKQTVPALPILDDVTNLSKKVNIYCEEKCDSATLTVGKKTYTIKKSKAKFVSSKNMYRYSKKIKRTDSGVKIKAYLTNKTGKSAVYESRKKEVVPDTPTLKKVSAGAKKITGHVDVVGDGSQVDGVTVENTKTRVFVFINGKKRKANVSFEGDYTLKLKNKVKAGTTIVVKARNKNGVSLKRKAIVAR